MKVLSHQPGESPPGFQQVRWASLSLRTPVSFLLWVPQRCYSEPVRRTPVLCLLHGSGHDSPSARRERFGFSLGDCSAVLVACQHPDPFGSAPSLLGSLDVEQVFPACQRLILLLGNDRAPWRQHNPTRLAHRLNGSALYFRTAENAFDRRQNAAFAAMLHVLQIPFEFPAYPGSHDTAFVQQQIEQHMAFHRRAFDRAMQS